MNKKHRETAKSCRGFTLVELMMALVLVFILTAAVYAVYKVQIRTSTAQDQVAEMQQNIRAAFLLLSRDLRMAGLDPTNSGKAGILVATATRFRFTQDITGDPVTGESDGDVNDPGEDVDYMLNGDVLGVQTGGAGGYQPVAENIHRLQFYYTLSDGTRTLAPTAAQLDDIETVTVSILARSSQEDHNYTDTKTYRLGDATVLGPFNDKFRRRLLVSEITCRNTVI
ncbi:MAG: hypothetical protein Kow0089_02620 [Desulfobulbaceae bacterium]